MLAIVLLMSSAVATDFCLYLLCACSRRTGTKTYIEVARVAFGAPGAVFATLVLLTLMFFVYVAYMILARDIWTSLIEVLWGGGDFSPDQQNLLLLVILILNLPACVQRDLHALRHICYVGFFSAVLLTLAIGYRCVEYNTQYPKATAQVKLVSTCLEDILSTVPILSLAFLCQFNMLGVHASFVNPTRERVKSILHGSMSMAASLYIMLGLMGSLYAYDNTRDDILLNFSANDKVVLLGRLGMGFTMFAAMPMICVPCRDALQSLWAQLWAGIRSVIEADHHGVVTADERAPLTSGTTATATAKTNADTAAAAEDDDTVSPVIKMLVHFVLTVAIMGTCYMVAVSLPGVAVVWSICGSSVGFLVSFGMPCMFYLRIRRKKAWNVRKACAWLLLGITGLLMYFCTAQAIKNSQAP
ncbi:unnamed protein product [Chrysoparadoxa australica]